MARRAQTKDIKNQGLVVALPMPGIKSALGCPALTNRLALRQHPTPIDTTVELVREPADFVFFRVRTLKIRGGGQHAGDQDRCVDARELALPGTMARFHIQEVIIKSLIAGGIGRGALLARGKESQNDERALNRLLTRQKAALDADRVDGQRHADRGDARGPIRPGLVQHQAIGRIRLVQKIGEGAPLQVI